MTSKFVGSPVRLFVGGRSYRSRQDVAAGALMVSDDGRTFRRVLDQPFVHDVIRSPQSARTLYAAASATYVRGQGQRPGIYRSTDNGSTWELVVEDLPHTFLHSLAFLPTAPERLLLGTNGAGIVSVLLPEL